MAAGPVTVAAASLGATGMNVLLRMISQEVIAKRRSRGLPILACNTSAPNIPGSLGDTVIVPLSSQPAAVRNLVDGNDFIADDDVEVSATVCLDNHHYTRIQISELARTQSDPVGLMSLLSGRLNSLLNDVENTVIDYLSANIVASVGTFGVNPTYATFVQARQALANAVTPNNDIAGFVDPDTYATMLQIAQIYQASQRGLNTQPSPAMIAGEQAGAVRPYLMAAGYPYYECTGVGSSGSSGVANLLFHKDAALFANKPIGQFTQVGHRRVSQLVDGIWITMTEGWDNDSQSETLTFECLFGITIGRNDFGVRILA